jgi:hypothetical protein
MQNRAGNGSRTKHLISLSIGMAFALTTASCRIINMPRTHDILVEARLLQLNIPLNEFGVNWGAPTAAFDPAIPGGQADSRTTYVTAVINPMDLEAVMNELRDSGNGAIVHATRVIVPSGGQVTIQSDKRRLVSLDNPSVPSTQEAVQQNKSKESMQPDLTVSLTPTIDASSNITAQIRVTTPRVATVLSEKGLHYTQVLRQEQVTFTNSVKGEATFALTDLLVPNASNSLSGASIPRSFFAVNEERRPVIILLTIARPGSISE